MNAPQKRFLRISEVARDSGVSPDTLRHYERKGVLPLPRRSENNYREYPEETAAHVRLIQHALRVGFTLDELARIFEIRDRGGVPCREVLALARSKLADVESRLQELQSLQIELGSLVADWESRLANTPKGERSGLLETLAQRVGLSKRQLVPLQRKDKPR